MNIGQQTESALLVYAAKTAAQVGSASISANSQHNWLFPKALHKIIHTLKACYGSIRASLAQKLYMLHTQQEAAWRLHRDASSLQLCLLGQWTQVCKLHHASHLLHHAGQF